MKTRVDVRPFLFEQMKQVNTTIENVIASENTTFSPLFPLFFTFYFQRKAKAHAEQTYRNKLTEAGLSEHFVEANGAAAEAPQTTSISSSEDEKDEHAIENDTQIRYAT